jgi:hypothetical protein
VVVCDFFEKRPLEDIRKVLGYMKTCPWQNEATVARLDRFFPKWKADLEDTLNRANVELEKAKRETAHHIYNLTLARRKLKPATDAVKRARNALERYGKVLSAYREIKALIL